MVAISKLHFIKTSLILASLVLASAHRAHAATCAGGEVGGTIFRDLDSNGAQSGVEVAATGAGMVVTAYSSAGAELATATVDATGNYSLGVISSTELASGVRLELTGVPSYLRDGAVGTNSSSSVQFITASGCSYQFAVHNTAEYCESSPNMSISCYQGGSSTGNSAASIITAGYSNSGLPIAYGGTATNPTPDATIANVGSVWGGAYQGRTKRLFMGTFLKRHVGIGPQGMGGVYVLDYSSGSAVAAATFTLQGQTPANGGAAIDVGSVTRNEVAGAITGDFDLSTTSTQPSIDLDAYPKVGAVGYGDLALDESGDTLWLMNLNQKALISVDVSGASSSLPGTVNQYLFSVLSGVPTCTGGNFRPFAIEFRDGRGYIGGVCDALTSQDAANLSAHVLSFDPDAPTLGFTSEVTFPLNFTREPIWSSPAGSTAVPNIVTATWRPWHTSDFLGSVTPYLASAAIGGGVGAAQPMLSNIRFLANGSMVLGFSDRWSHQAGYVNYIPVSATAIAIEAMSGGDTLLVCRVNGAWVVEGGAGCSNFDTDTISTVDGPNGNGEFFRHDDFFFSGGGTHVLSTHSETGLGGIAVVPSTGEVLTVSFDPLPDTIHVRTNGFSRFSASDGSFLAGYLIVPDPLVFPGYLGKAGGLGEPILRCSRAPIEIGNRLWLDADEDGVQDPGESPLAGVTVGLCNSSQTVLTTVTTDANGQYLFSSRAATTTSSTAYNIAELLPEASGLSICISLAQTALASYLVTTQDNDASTNGDARDSDCISSSGSARIPFTVGGSGENNHRYDCGFTTNSCSNSLASRSLRLDSAVTQLRNTLTQTVNLRTEYGESGACAPVDSDSRQSILDGGETNYIAAWNIAWVLLPQRDYSGCTRSSISCSATTTRTSKRSLLAYARSIKRSAEQLVSGVCMSSREGGRAKRARAIQQQLNTTWSILTRTVKRYPRSVVACG